MTNYTHRAKYIGQTYNKLGNTKTVKYVQFGLHINSCSAAQE